MNSSDNLVTPPERQATVRLHDGRSIAWSEWGPLDGLPVLFCTGAATSGRLGFGAKDLPRLGLKLIAFDRPGLGKSEPHPGKTLTSWAEDIGTVLEDRGWDGAVAVGFSQGAPFALTLAGMGLVQALAVVSGQDELSHHSIKPLLHPDVVKMVDAAHQDPTGFETYISQFATWDGLWQLIMNMSGERDRAVYREKTFSDTFQQALKEGFSQGPQGYARDLVNALGPWPVAPEEIAVPVDLWYGGLDTSTVHSPDFGATLAARLPNASHTLDTMEGGSILWTRSAEILGKLKARTLEAG